MFTNETGSTTAMIDGRGYPVGHIGSLGVKHPFLTGFVLLFGIIQIAVLTLNTLKGKNADAKDMWNDLFERR